MGGDHLIVDGAGYAHATGGVLLLPHAQVNRHPDPGLEPALRTGAALVIAFPDHEAYARTTLTALLARLAALRLP